MLCSRAFRSSVLSNFPPTEQGKEDGIYAVAMLMAELVRLVRGTIPAGEGSSRE